MESNSWLRIWIFGDWNCETAASYSREPGDLGETWIDASTDFRGAPARATRSFACARSNQSSRQDAGSRRRHPHRECQRRACRAVRIACTGHQNHHREQHHTKDGRGSHSPAAAIQPRRLTGARRIQRASSQFLERLFPAGDQLGACITDSQVFLSEISHVGAQHVHAGSLGAAPFFLLHFLFPARHSARG